jgi:hypothetical protein
MLLNRFFGLTGWFFRGLKTGLVRLNPALKTRSWFKLSDGEPGNYNNIEYRAYPFLHARNSHCKKKDQLNSQSSGNGKNLSEKLDILSLLHLYNFKVEIRTD